MAGPFQGMYENMKFPDYKYKEYPKWIGTGKTAQIVHSQSEELAILATDPEAAKNDPILAAKQQLENQLTAEKLERRKMELELEELRKQLGAKAEDKVSVTISAPVIDPSTPIEVKSPPKAK